MSWSYTDPTASDRDKVRFLVGDTDSTDEQLQDEELDWLIGENKNVYAAASEACEALASKYARQVTKSVGPLMIQAQQKKDQYEDRAEKLRAMAARRGSVPVPYAGGLSVTEKDTDVLDTVLIQPRFRVGDHEHD